MKELPNYPSALIRLAVKDLELVEKDNKYNVSMLNWHTPYFEDETKDHDADNVEVCNVCFAGAVMAKSLDYALWGEGDFNSDDKYADHFYFLDQIRQYELYNEYAEGIMGTLFKSDEEMSKITLGLEKVGEFIVHHLDDKAEYDEDSGLFKKNMLAIADKFEECGL